jgi:hypothetical protein
LGRWLVFWWIAALVAVAVVVAVVVVVLLAPPFHGGGHEARRQPNGVRARGERGGVRYGAPVYVGGTEASQAERVQATGHGTALQLGRQVAQSRRCFVHLSNDHDGQ